MILAIDFDGTIVTDKYPCIGELMPGAKKYINLLYDSHYIILWTCRSGDELLDAVNFLLDKGIKFHRVNDNSPLNVRKYGNNCRKVGADLYIDDRTFSGHISWKEMYRHIETISMEQILQNI